MANVEYYCAKCNAEIDISDKYCSKCGTKFTKHEELRAEIERLASLVNAQSNYIEVLCKELNETVPIASSLGWKSYLSEQGKAIREVIHKLEKVGDYT